MLRWRIVMKIRMGELCSVGIWFEKGEGSNDFGRSRFKKCVL